MEMEVMFSKSKQIVESSSLLRRAYGRINAAIWFWNMMSLMTVLTWQKKSIWREIMSLV